MNDFTIITMILVLSVVWGGFTFFLIKAYKHEKIKKENGG